MSAAAIGAAGFLRLRDRARGRRGPLPALQPQDGEVEAFVQMLIRRGIAEPRARELVAEQSAKHFNRARSGARR